MSFSGEEWSLFFITVRPEQLMELLGIILRIVLILILGYLLLRLGRYLIDRIFRVHKKKVMRLETAQILTLNKLLKSILGYVVYFFLATIILGLLDVPVASLLAGAGILGLAIGFGAQSLVSDIISGFFIIFENQFTVGDFVKAGEAEGFVEEVGLRSTKIRAFSGEIHILRNGLINNVTNYSRTNMRIRVIVSVAYEENVERVIKVLDEVCTQVDEEMEDIVEAPKVLGVNDLGESGVDILIIGRAKPLTSWAAERRLRYLIKERFDREGIEIPYPKRVIYSRDMANMEERAEGKSGDEEI